MGNFQTTAAVGVYAPLPLLVEYRSTPPLEEQAKNIANILRAAKAAHTIDAYWHSKFWQKVAAVETTSPWCQRSKQYYRVTVTLHPPLLRPISAQLWSKWHAAEEFLMSLWRQPSTRE